tara:strand:+ start:419 stop:547 length:129 start_codon:yes stop_codon:yes gene_type:complete
MFRKIIEQRVLDHAAIYGVAIHAISNTKYECDAYYRTIVDSE